MNINELRKFPHWSYSAMNCYLGCSLQYYFRYVAKAEPEQTSVCFPFGKAFHSALTLFALKHCPANDLTDAFAEYFKAELKVNPDVKFKRDDDEDSMIALADRMLNVASANWNPVQEVISTAEGFSLCLPGIETPLIGEFDMVCKVHDIIQIVDWKTAAARWSAGKADRDLQATVFSYAFRKLHGIIPEFRFDVITKTKQPTIESHFTSRNLVDFEGFEVMARIFHKGVKQEIFLPNPGCFGCAECPYANQCKNWRG